MVIMEYTDGPPAGLRRQQAGPQRNAFNKQHATFENPNSVKRGTTPNPLPGKETIRETPRYLRLSVSYGF